MQPTVIITGGQGSLARALEDFFHLREPAWKILCPSRQELDVTNHNSIHPYLSEHPCDFLIAAAGKIADAPLAKLDETTWSELLSVNLRGAALCAKYASKVMLKRRCGHIVFLSSYSAHHPPMGQIAYASAKAGLEGLAKSLAREWGRANIRVNAIFPGFLDNRMTAAVSPDRREQVLETHCLERFNSEPAVAAFLHTLHTQMPHTSGQIFNLDSRILT
jgi:3-oxoacyl-[acyl-carrier protein] reductase